VQSPLTPPLSVPAAAVYVPETDEWSIGTVDAEGKPCGLHRSFRASGEPASDYHYVHGELEGPFQRLHPNGEVARRGEYRGGRLHGTVEAFACRGADSPERLRSCCVPPGAFRLEARYDDGTLLWEHFYNEKGERILHDGTVYPIKAAHLPKEAELDEFSKLWYVRRFAEGELDGPFQSWSAEGTPIQQATYSRGKLHGTNRLFSDAGQLREEADYESGLRSGRFRRIYSASPYTDARIREERGTMKDDLVVGEWHFLDETGALVRTAHFGARCDDVARSAALARDDRTADEWQRLGRDLLTTGRPGEAICAFARACAVSRRTDAFLGILDEIRPLLLGQHALAIALHAIEKSEGRLDVLLDALLRGGDPAALLRGMAACGPIPSRASLDLVDAAILLAPDREEYRVTRILVALSIGDPDGAEQETKTLGNAYIEQRQSLLSYRRVLFPKFDFWPARARFDSLLADMPEEPCQPLSKFREVIQKYATRLQTLRRAIAEQAGGNRAWLLPDLSALLPRGPVPLEHRSFDIVFEDEDLEPDLNDTNGRDIEHVTVDERLDLQGLDVRSLMRLARSEWNALAWLCWSAGLDSMGLPERLAPPAGFGQAVGMAIERQWRARDRLVSYGLIARTKGVRGFEWEGMQIDEMPAFLAEIVAEEYTDLRALFFFLCDDHQQSPWQDNLRRSS
jgi:antitoxin component YwqK of YwqJK toxin-antitoxin module